MDAYVNRPLPGELQARIRAWFVHEGDRAEKDEALFRIFNKIVRFENHRDHSLDESYLKVCKRIGYTPGDLSTSTFINSAYPTPLRRRMVFRVAAVVAPVLLLLSVAVMREWNTNNSFMADAVVESSLEDTKKIVLPDGSHVTLNSNSVLAYTNERRADLEGEAYFSIVKDSRPFVIHTDDLDINVLGTEFLVTAFPDDDFIEVSLYSGSVVLESGETRIELRPDQKFRLNKIGGVQSVVAMDPESDEYMPPG